MSFTVKRAGLLVLFVVGFALAGAFSAVVVAETTSTATTGTQTTTTATTATTTTTPAPAVLPARVRVANVEVGGMDTASAAAAVRAAFSEPLPVVVDRTRFDLDPSRFASAYVEGAIARARAAAPGSKVNLVVAVRGVDVRAFARKLDARFSGKPVDAVLSLRNGRPRITKDRPGHRFDAAAATRAIDHALAANTREPVRLATKPIAPKVTQKSFGAVIVINRSANRLSLYRNATPWRVFGVATGQSRYPTPSGSFHVIVKWANPTWTPPASSWAQGLKPIPPGPGNPLGTRWMGISAPGVGIHGTPDPGSIGYSASHGCIRMLIPDAEWLFQHVIIGTPVFII